MIAPGLNYWFELMDIIARVRDFRKHEQIGVRRQALPHERSTGFGISATMFCP